MRWGQLLLAAAIAGVIGRQFYSASLNTIHGLSGPRFNLAVRNTPSLAEIDVGKELDGFESYRMQARYVKVAPGATIRIHDHFGRPAFSYVVNTTVDQHRSDLPGPLRMKPGDLSSETNVSHWWRNTGGYTLTFYVVDLKPLGEKDSAAGVFAKIGGGARADDFVIAGPPPGTGPSEEHAVEAEFAAPAPELSSAMAVVEARTIDLGEAFPDNPAASGRTFRARKIALAPGTRADGLGAPGRPAIYYVTAGEVVERRGDAAPVKRSLYEAGAATSDAPIVIGNDSEASAEILVVDLIAKQ